MSVFVTSCPDFCTTLYYKIRSESKTNRSQQIIRSTLLAQLNYGGLPVRNCRKVEVQVHSGFPSLREKRHSRCKMEPGNTARSPDGSTEAEPDGILINTVGGESSANKTRQLSNTSPRASRNTHPHKFQFILQTVKGALHRPNSNYRFRN